LQRHVGLASKKLSKMGLGYTPLQRCPNCGTRTTSASLLATCPASCSALMDGWKAHARCCHWLAISAAAAFTAKVAARLTAQVNGNGGRGSRLFVTLGKEYTSTFFLLNTTTAHLQCLNKNPGWLCAS